MTVPEGKPRDSVADTLRVETLLLVWERVGDTVEVELFVAGSDVMLPVAETLARLTVCVKDWDTVAVIETASLMDGEEDAADSDRSADGVGDRDGERTRDFVRLGVALAE